MKDYRNIGIMAHIDAGKVRAISVAAVLCWWRY
jgi:predicted membrane GTPase involved in stress response